MRSKPGAADLLSRHAVDIFLTILTICVLFAVTSAAQKTTRKPVVVDRLALGEEEVRQLLLLIDTDENGKISKQEFMKFMEAEFDRLDTNKNGELDPKELSRSRIRAGEHAATKK